MQISGLFFIFYNTILPLCKIHYHFYLELCCACLCWRNSQPKMAGMLCFLGHVVLYTYQCNMFPFCITCACYVWCTNFSNSDRIDAFLIMSAQAHYIAFSNDLRQLSFQDNTWNTRWNHLRRAELNFGSYYVPFVIYFSLSHVVSLYIFRENLMRDLNVE